MLNFNKDEVRKKLHQEYGFDKEKIERGIHLLLELDERLQPLLDQWLKDGTISEQKLNGVSLDMMYKYYAAEDFIDALLSIEMFVVDKELAEMFLKDPSYYLARK